MRACARVCVALPAGVGGKETDVSGGKDEEGSAGDLRFRVAPIGSAIEAPTGRASARLFCCAFICLDLFCNAWK